MAQSSPETSTFREFIINEYTAHSGYHKAPEGLDLSFCSFEPYLNEPEVPTLHANFTPPMFGHGPGFSSYLYEVHSAGFWKVQADPHNALKVSMGNFEVYDFDIARLSDPTVTERLREIVAGNVTVVTDYLARREHGFLVDPEVRSRVLEYHQARQKNETWREVEKYVRLRKAPFAKNNIPGYGLYTYQGVLNEAFARSKSTSLGWQPVAFRMFQPEDAEWMQTFMRNQGLDTPEIEEIEGRRLS